MSYIPPPATVYFPLNEVCSISHEPLPALYRQNRLVQASCAHFFDRDSIQTWTRQNSSCPVCRQHNITIRQVQILPQNEGLLDKLGRLIMKILEIVWKGIVFLFEVIMLSNSSTVYVVENRSRNNASLRSPMYVPPQAPRRTDYVPPPADRGRGRVELGARNPLSESVYVPSEDVRNGRVVLGRRANN